MYAQEIVYIGFGAIRGFRHPPLGSLGIYPPKGQGASLPFCPPLRLTAYYWYSCLHSGFFSPIYPLPCCSRGLLKIQVIPLLEIQHRFLKKKKRVQTPKHTRCFMIWIPPTQLVSSSTGICSLYCIQNTYISYLPFLLLLFPSPS